jgi:hypothetical protein
MRVKRRRTNFNKCELVVSRFVGVGDFSSCEASDDIIRAVFARVFAFSLAKRDQNAEDVDVQII